MDLLNPLWTLNIHIDIKNYYTKNCKLFKSVLLVLYLQGVSFSFNENFPIQN